MRPILILGGTTEARLLAVETAARGVAVILSYAGRTQAPRALPVPMRVGGFGGVAGLAAYLRAENIGHVIDATHPFAAQMTRNAVTACAQAKVPYLALERPPWQAGPGDNWRPVADFTEAAQALPAVPACVFLATGRQTIAPFTAFAQHRYILRFVDPPGPLPLTDYVVETGRGPFEAEADRALMLRHGVDLVVAKNAGGAGADAKLHAARALGLPVIMIARPPVPARPVVTSNDQVFARLHADLGV